MESSAADALIAIRQTMKFYEQCLDGVRRDYQLSRLEIIIISFLHNNPGHDTVGEIAELRMLSKGNVSREADVLIKRGLLERVPDQRDRRWVHLRLRPEVAPIVEQINLANQAFSQKIFDGFSAEDMEAFRVLNRRLAANICRSMERSPTNHGE